MWLAAWLFITVISLLLKLFNANPEYIFSGSISLWEFSLKILSSKQITVQFILYTRSVTPPKFLNTGKIRANYDMVK